MNLPLFGWLGVVAALLFLITLLVVYYKKLFKVKLRIRMHHIFTVAAVVFVLIHIIMALNLYLPSLPFFVWLGLIAVLLFLAAIVVMIKKDLVKPRSRIKVHRLLALLAAVFASAHIYLALRVYF